MFSYLADKLNVKNLGEIIAPTLTPIQELHAAIEEGLDAKFQQLVEEQQLDPSSPQAQNDGGNLPIHTACYFGRLRIVEYLLNQPNGFVCDVNLVGPRDNTPLHFASSQGHEQVVRLLIDRGANPAMRNRHGKTAYDIAKGDRIRQFLLPLQFRHEDPKQAASMVPAGITPSVDPMAPRPVLAPPPMAGAPPMAGGAASGGYSDVSMNDPNQQQYQQPMNPMFAAPRHSAIPRNVQQNRVNREYRPIQADGFGTSVGNEELTAKYGNTKEVKQTAPPPLINKPMMSPPHSTGSAASEGSISAPPNANANSTANPYSAMGARSDNSPPRSGGPFGGPAQAPRGPPQFKIFNPKLVANNGSNNSSASSSPAHRTAPQQPNGTGMAPPAPMGAMAPAQNPTYAGIARQGASSPAPVPSPPVSATPPVQQQPTVSSGNSAGGAFMQSVNLDTPAHEEEVTLSATTSLVQ